MATIHREAVIDATPEQVWDAVRDIGAIHTRLAPTFVIDVKLEPGARMVTFANGMVAKELIVDVDDSARRLAWSVVGTQMTHHNASMQIFSEADGRSRAVWIADLLPNELAPRIAAMIEQGLAATKQNLESVASAIPSIRRRA